MPRRRPRILLGVTGSVAAVKGPRLALRLAQEVKADVKVILTRTVEQHFWREGRAVPSYDGEGWREFLAATSASSSTSDEAVGGSDRRSSSDGSISIHYAEEEWASYNSLKDSVLHIDLRNWADICLIAPLSAHTLAKIANGLCDDLLSCCMRAWDFGQRMSLDGGGMKGKPVILAPAMNTAMWDHPLTKMQLATIQQFAGAPDAVGNDKESKRESGVVIVEPAVKTLACGEVGAGALAELDDIIDAVKGCLVQWKENGSDATASNDPTKDSRIASMKRALLLYAKKKFHEKQSNGGAASQIAAPISPTPNLVIESFLPRLNLTSKSMLIDLGCGDGRWLIAANEHTQCRCLGIDVDEERLKIARESISKNNLRKFVEVRNQDVFEFVEQSDDIGRADVIVMYLFREAIVKMGALLRQRLIRVEDASEAIPRKRVQILSVGFALTGWTSVHEEKIDGIRVHLYSTNG